MTLNDNDLKIICEDIIQGKRSGITLQYTEDGFRIFSPPHGYAYSIIQGSQQIPPQEFSIDSLNNMSLHDGDLIGIWLNEQDSTIAVTFSKYTKSESEAKDYCVKTQQLGYYSFSQGKTIYLSR